MKIISIVGARPNFMKIAPIDRVLRTQVEHIIVHTGQHYDKGLSDVFFKELGISEPKYNLGIGSHPREKQIELIMEAFAPVVREEKPDIVLVVGDVNSTVACSRVARENNIKVAHVEAGLRSFDKTMPEEINRIETDQLSDFLFVTEPSGLKNLEEEGVRGEVHHVGNVMIDTLVANLENLEQGREGEYAVATFHRPSNVDTEESLRGVIKILERAASHCTTVFPVHPRTEASLKKHGLWSELEDIPGLELEKPLSYNQFMSLVRSARFVVTDSGGIQEETTWLGVPCITMRDNTERPVTVEVGTNYLATADPDKTLEILEKVATGEVKKASIPDKWDGKTAERIAKILTETVL